MICKSLCEAVKTALDNIFDGSIGINIAPVPVDFERGKLYIRTPKLVFNRRTFPADEVDTVQRMTVYLEIVYYPFGTVDVSDGCSEMLEALGNIRLSEASYILSSCTLRTHRTHYSLTVGYAIPISAFGLR